MPKTQQLNKEYFLARVIIDPETDCWICKQAKVDKRYGSLTYKNKRYLAHRLAYKTLKGEIPPTKVVCHTCDNGLCVNPDHLFLGTQKDNLTDMKQKGRSTKGRGTLRKFTIDDFENMYKLYLSGKNKNQIAIMYNTCRSYVGYVIKKLVKNKEATCQNNSQTQTLETPKSQDSESLSEDNSQLSFNFSETSESYGAQYYRSMIEKMRKS